MRPTKTTALIALALLCSLAPPSAEARRSSEARLEAIETRSIEVPGSEIRAGRASTVIHAPYERVLEHLHDYGSYAQLFPEFNASRVLTSRGHEALVYLEARVAYDTFTLWGNLRVSSKEEEGGRVIDVSLKRGNVSQFHAVWTLRPLEGGESCAIDFQLLVDPNMKLPNSVISSENVKAARRAVSALRRHVVR